MSQNFSPAGIRETQLRTEMANFAVQVAWSLTQPWATLMAIGAKLNETRSGRGMPNYTGWVAIHAAKNFPPECRDLWEQSPFVDALRAAGYSSWKELPLGSVLAVTRITAIKATAEIRDSITDTEREFGDYSAGRRAFVTEDLRRLRHPFEARGMLGIWKLPRRITLEDLIWEGGTV